MFLRGLVFILVMGFLTSCAHAPKQPDGITEPIPVTVEELVENPEFFHGKRVILSGFLASSFIYEALYASESIFFLAKLGLLDDDEHGPLTVIRDGEVPVEYSDLTSPGKRDFYPLGFFERVNVRITATFDAVPAGYNPKTETWDVILDGFGLTLAKVERIEFLDRPEIPTSTMRKVEEIFWSNIQGFSLEEDAFFEIVEKRHPEYGSLSEFVYSWLQALENRDYEFLKRTLLVSEDVTYQDENWDEISDPENYLHLLLFDPSSPFQTYLHQNPKREIVLHRQKADMKEKFEPYRTRVACFCLEDDCSDIWPLTLWLANARALTDNFICIGLHKSEIGWKWDIY